MRLIFSYLMISFSGVAFSINDRQQNDVFQMSLRMESTLEIHRMVSIFSNILQRLSLSRFQLLRWFALVCFLLINLLTSDERENIKLNFTAVWSHRVFIECSLLLPKKIWHYRSSDMWYLVMSNGWSHPATVFCYVQFSPANNRWFSSNWWPPKSYYI